MTIYAALLCFFIYGFLGWAVEVAYAGIKEKKFVNRGFLKGPICPIYGVSVTLVALLLERFRSNVFLLFILSFLLVTLLEGITGFVLEHLFHNKWWDYSDEKFNIGGYVCLKFSLIWGVSCVVVVEFVQRFFEFDINHLHKLIGIPLIVIFTVMLIIDHITTTTKIAKMNKHLAYMENIANELHNISNGIGEGIYKAVDALDGDEDIEAKKAELTEKYNKALGDHSKAAARLVKAFPTMTSKRYDTALSDTRENIKNNPKPARHKKTAK